MASEVTQTYKQFFGSLGADIKEMRERIGLSQAEIANVMGWGRFAMSKIETGQTNLSLFDYLRLISTLEEAERGHPAFTVMRRYGGRKAITAPPATT